MSPRAVGQPAHTRARLLRRITWEIVLLVANPCSFFIPECDNGKQEMLDEPLDRTAEATGLSRSTIIRIANEEYANARPESGKRERRKTE